MTSGYEPQVRSVDRAFSILELFSADTPRLSLAELVEGSGLPKTTVVRLLADLQARALVVPESTSTFVLGPGLLRWVVLADGLWRVSDETRVTMRALVDEIGETVCVYVRQGIRRTPIALHPGVHTVRNVVELGALLPLGLGAAGKLLLSHSPDLLEQVVEDNPALDAAVLRAELERIAAQGFASSSGERELGAAAVAAPIRNAQGRVVAALAMSGPSSRFTGELVERALTALQAGAEQVSRDGLGPVEVVL